MLAKLEKLPFSLENTSLKAKKKKISQFYSFSDFNVGNKMTSFIE